MNVRRNESREKKLRPVADEPGVTLTWTANGIEISNGKTNVSVTNCGICTNIT